MNKNNTSKQKSLLFALLAFFTGLIIVFLALYIDLIYKGIPINLKAFATLYSTDPVQWIIAPLPFLLAIPVYLFSKTTLTTLSKNSIQIEESDRLAHKVQNFVNKLISDELDAEYDLTDEDDKVGRSLNELKNNIRQNKEEVERRRKEDDQRNWVAEGLARFSEILRNDNDNMEELSYNVISNLVKYVNANQGGFFIINDNDPSDKHFEMTASYAYERRKYPDRRLNWGEGLIGTCALELETIHMNEIPDSYVNITSGLGESSPRALLIVPLIINEEVHGVVEIASFKKFAKHEIEFIEKIAESIASTISSVKINVKTNRLLKESQEQAETLASQEEEMRQNMEELQATQEEAARQAEKFVSFTNSVNHTLIRAEYKTDGTLIYANTKFLKKLGYSGNSEVEGKHISMFVNQKDRLWFDPIWDKLSIGGKHFEGDMKHVTKQGQDLWTMATYTCVRKEDDTVEKILFLAIDTTEQKKQSLDFEGQIEALNRANIKGEFTPEGEIVENNELFREVFDYTSKQIKNTTIWQYFPKEDHEKLQTIWDDVSSGKPFQGQLRMINRQKEEKWFRITLSAVNDMYGEVAKIILLAQDVTKEKQMEIETEKQTEQLRIQEEKLRKAGEELAKKLDEAKIGNEKPV